MRRFTLIMSVIVLSSILLFACASEPASTQVESAEPVEVVEDVGTVDAVTEDVAQTEVEEEAVVQPEEGVVEEAPEVEVEAEQEAEVVVEAAPTPRPDLIATDPATVSLASGDVQLVEMFAFW